VTPPGPLVRPPAVAGSFYPADPSALRAALRAAFDDAVGPDGGGEPPVALVVPHAGYLYSGTTAASAYLRLGVVRAHTRRIVLLGPSHRVRVDGLAVTSAEVFSTPLGDVPIDAAGRDVALEAGPFVRTDDAPHVAEHSLEVQLPFLQAVLDNFELLPLAVGRPSAEDVAAVLDAVWDDGTVVVVSTDLSHYHPAADAQAMDERTAAAVVALSPERVDDIAACGAHALRGLLMAARRRELKVELVDLGNSGDVTGDRDRVVGYGAFVFTRGPRGNPAIGPRAMGKVR
jgi:AmmeMemoRadiSam system protein B